MLFFNDINNYMRKNILKKIIIAIVLLILYTIINSKKIDAASASISANKTNVTVGDSVTINASATGCLSQINISGAGVSGSIDIVSTDLSNKTDSKSFKLDTSKPGTYTVTMKGSLVDANRTESTVNKSVTITVTEKPSSRDNTITQNGSSNNNSSNSNTTKEPTFKSANTTMYSTGNINVRKSYSADSDKLGTLQTGEKVTVTGTGDNGWSKISFNGGTGYVKTSLLTKDEPKKSEDKALKSIEITGYEMDPAFDPEITDYSVEVKKDDEKLEIKATPNNEKATVDISGNEGLKSGDNVIKITVTAEDGTTRIYSINATKKNNEKIGLTSLKIDGYSLSPKFSSDVYEYKVTILDPKVNSLKVTGESNVENAKIETVGNTNLKPGNNIITVSVESPDGTQKTTYKITVNKSSAAGTTSKKKDNMILYAGIGAIVLLIIIIAIIVIRKRRNSERVEDEEYEEDDDENYENLYGYSSKEQKSTDNINKKKNEYNVFQNTEDKKAIEEELFGKIPEPEVEKQKYEDNFNYNAYNTKDMYEGFEDNKVTKSSTSDTQRFDYTAEKPDYKKLIDSINGTAENAESNFKSVPNVEKNDYLSDSFGSAQDNSGYSSSRDNWNYDDDDDGYKSRRSKGKHAK